MRVPEGMVLDLGCGRWPGADASGTLGRPVLGVDWCPTGLPAGCAVADAAALPFADSSFGTVWCNLAALWLDDPAAALAEMRRVLAPGGLLLTATLGPASLEEVRSAFRGGAPRTMGFFDMHDWGDLLGRCGFAEPVVDSETFVLAYPSGKCLLAELAGWGALAAPGMRKALAGKEAMRAATASLDAAPGGPRLTLEGIYAHAWALPQRAAKMPADWQEIGLYPPKGDN